MHEEKRLSCGKSRRLSIGDCKEGRGRKEAELPGISLDPLQAGRRGVAGGVGPW